MHFVQKHLETDPIFYRRLFKIAVPVILQSLITTGVNLVDNIMLGQLTETALSAATQANQFINLFVFAIMGISMGSSVLSSRFWGARDIRSLKKVITIALRFGLLLGLLFTLADVLLPEKIMSLYFSPTETAEISAGVVYLRWSTATFLLMSVSFVLTNIMRSAGLTNVPLIASLSAFGINIGANYIFIFGKLGAPALGVAGAALGTLIARVVETGIIAAYFLRDRTIHYRLRDLLMPCRELVGEFLRISIPVLLSDLMLGLGDNALAIIMGRIGPGFVTANSITMVVQRISTIFITGLSFSGCFLTGQVLGEGSVDAAKRQGNTYLLLGLIIGAAAAGFIQLLSGWVIGAYNITPETREIARELMDGVSIIVVFRAANSILTRGVLRGGGDTQFLLLADMSTMWLLAVPLGAVAGLYFHLNAFWTYLCLYSDQMAKAVWCVFRLRSGKWIKKIKGAA